MRIVQLSDLHLTSDGSLLYGRVNTWAAFAAAVIRVQALAPKADFLLLTGDLANDGDLPTYRRLADRLRALGIPYAVMPGNHDRRGAMREGFPAQAWNAGELCCQSVDLGGGRLMLLDTLVPGEEWGEVSSAQLAWLEAISGGRPALLAMHHPPFAIGISGMDAIRCREEERLATWLQGRPEVAAVLCGHVHRFVATSFAGRPALTAPSPVHQIAIADGPLAWTEEPGGFLLHEWDPGAPLVTHYVPIAAAPAYRYED